MTTLDGFMAGPKGEIDWHLVDDEFNQYALELTNAVDTIHFGRVTYQLFESYWPAMATDPATSKDDREIARRIEELTKIVFSRTLDAVAWKDARLAQGAIAEEVANLKQQPGQDMVIYGSASPAQGLMEHGLIDEFRIMVNPVVLRSGKPLFKSGADLIPLKLIDARTFGSGLVLLARARQQSAWSGQSSLR